MKKIKFILIPRILIIAYILFISLFALDTPFGIGFVIHLVPSIIFSLILIFAWFKPKIGGILFILAGIGTIIFFNSYRNWFVFFIVSTIPMIAGVLFWIFKGKK